MAAPEQLEPGPTLSFARTMVIGASVSAGFLGTPLAELLDESIQEAHEIKSVADVYFVREPLTRGEEQVSTALDWDATVVFGLDILFWYVYSYHPDLDGRMAQLDRALTNLERISVPLIIGDVPDMRHARAWMLPPEMVPPAEQLEALNQRVRAWAQSRPQVHLMPLAAWARPLHTGESVVDDDGATRSTRELVSLDGLHLSPAGARYVLRRITAELAQTFPENSLRPIK